MASYLTASRADSRIAPVDPGMTGADVELPETPYAEHAIIEWLLHDDQVMRECFLHVSEILRCATGAPVTAITLHDSYHSHYRAELGARLPPVPYETSLCWFAMHAPGLLVIEDATADSRYRDCAIVRGDHRIRFYAGITIAAPDGRPVGALCAMGPTPRSVTPAQAHVFQHLKAMLENDLRLRSATAIDPLTRLFNRRHMLETVRERWRHAHHGAALGTVVIDIDWFKNYNDTYGHPAGDTCLQAVAAVIQATADKYELVAGRLGGEEFGMLQGVADGAQLAEALEALRHGVEALGIEHRRSPIGHVTLSIGGTITVKDARAEGSGVIQGHRAGFVAADRALYTAKESGRNRVVMV